MQRARCFEVEAVATTCNGIRFFFRACIRHPGFVFLFADARAAPSRVERATYVIRRRRDAAQASLLSRSNTQTGTTVLRRRGRGGTAYCYSGLTRRLGRPIGQSISFSLDCTFPRPVSLRAALRALVYPTRVDVHTFEA